jgi:hypothetical protein
MRHTDEERLSGYYVGWNGNVNRNCGEAEQNLTADDSDRSDLCR